MSSTYDVKSLCSSGLNMICVAVVDRTVAAIRLAELIDVATRGDGLMDPWRNVVVAKIENDAQPYLRKLGELGLHLL